MKISLLILTLISFNLWGNDFKNFQPGDGARYNMIFKGSDSADVSIYVTESSSNKVGVEYFISAGNTQMWQQFVLVIGTDNQIKISEGFLKTPEFSKPEKMNDEHLKGTNGGVEFNDFIFSKTQDIKKYFIAHEKLKINSKMISADHYKKENNGQTIDYWISDKTKPFGLVKLTSQSEKNSNQNYELVIETVLKNVQATINRTEAIPLTAAGKKILDAKNN